METVRVGIAIRKGEVRFRLSGDCRLTSPGSGATMLGAGEYVAKVSEAGEKPVWGAKLCTFIDAGLAENAAAVLQRHGINAELVEMGGRVRWGGEELETTVASAVIGRDSDATAVAADVRARLQTIPAQFTRGIPGLRRFEDELPRVEAIRLKHPEGGRIELWSVEGGEPTPLPSPVCIEPLREGWPFALAEVKIGIGFHWERDETLPFRGTLELIADGAAVTAVNEVALDDYLAALLGSEMRPDWPEEALKAQAVAARSTVLATRNRHHWGEAFHLCHDDHCQDYQGMSRESDLARQALDSLRGVVLTHQGRVADARYAKISGVLTEAHEIAWDDEAVGYLVPVPCGPAEGGHQEEIRGMMRCGGEENLTEWLNDPPGWSACNPATYPYAESAVGMEKLFHWQAVLSWDEVSELVKRRTGRDIGAALRLEPLERGVSGRIVYLRVHGTKGTVTVGKELAVRRLLSESHLPSSAFLVRPEGDGIVLDGLGWGHGVGLCQLGAVGLARAGWSFERILERFYPGTALLRG